MQVRSWQGALQCTASRTPSRPWFRLRFLRPSRLPSCLDCAGAIAILLSLLAPPAAQAVTAQGLRDWFKDCPLGDAPTCAAALEARELGSAGDAVERAGPVLTLKTDRAALRFEDPDSPTVLPLHHHYLGALDGTDLRVVWAIGAGGGCSRYWLVSQRSARPIAVENLPEISPGGGHLVVLAGDGQRQPSSLTLLTRTAGGWAQELRFEPSGGVVYGFKAWQGDDAVQLEMKTRRPGGRPDKDWVTQSLVLHDGAHGWELTPGRLVALRR